ncbi:hypothetical protein AWB78_01320 [Caballeronia calidae]|uniref:DUF1376 domain-containing protein n=1 Tax=Caballeronia calidae TaxID=1777139 RepID=A0A158A6C3_9BURK|nr:DUF1376 domain-containing protein [Caballeronia calidae]SAK53382.1 hypothetical protein AWB78_01320 [Caballeronia calidae]
MTDLPNPLTPADCDLRDFGFMQIDVKRLLSSETWVLGTGEERAAAVALWLESWHQVPAGSLPENDRMLDHLSQSKKWKSVKAHVMRGWLKCSDGRFYHQVVAEKALEAWIEKLLNRFSGAVGNATRWNVETDTGPLRARLIEAVNLLTEIAPRSKTLTKKRVLQILKGSPSDPKDHPPERPYSSPPESPPDEIPPPSNSRHESPPDRKGEGEGEFKTIGSNNGSGPPRARDENAPLAAAEISDALVAWERDRGKVARNITPAQEQVLELAALDVTAAELRKAYDAAVADRDATGDPSPINPGFVRTFVEKHRRPERPKRDPPIPLNSMTDIQLNALGKELGIGESRIGEYRPQFIARILQKQDEIRGRIA